MEDHDTQNLSEFDDEDMFLSDVVKDEHELLFLDSYLRESFKRGRRHSTVSAADEFFDE
jgi:hypothetical protein